MLFAESLAGVEASGESQFLKNSLIWKFSKTLKLRSFVFSKSLQNIIENFTTRIGFDNFNFLQNIGQKLRKISKCGRLIFQSQGTCLLAER